MRRLLAMVLAVAGVSSWLPAGAQPGPIAGIRSLLDTRASALMRGDREVFLSTVAPGADPGFVERQRLLFEGFAKIGLAEYHLSLETETWGDLATTMERERHGPEAHVFHVEERYRLRGFDEEPALEDLFLTFVPAADGWAIASDSDLDDLTLYSSRKLWELGPVVVRRSRRVLYVSHPPRAGEAARLSDLVQEAMDELSLRWRLPWNERVVLLVPTNTPELKRLIQATFDLDVFVAFATSSVDRERDWRLAGHRVVVHWPNFSRYARDIQRDILVHELLHVATRGHSGPFVPAFVDEGIAEWVLGEDGGALLESRVADGTFDRSLPLDHEFSSGTGGSILLSYQEATSAMDFAARRFGPRSLERLYRTLGAARLEPGTWRAHVSRVMRSAFGMGLARFERAWARDVLLP